MSLSRAFLFVAAAVVLFLVVVALVWPPTWWAEDDEQTALEGDVAGAITYELEQVDNSGQFGFVTLEPTDDGSGTRVFIDLGAFPEVPQPAYVQQGTCADPGKELYSLGAVRERGGEDNPGTTMATLDVPIAELQQGTKSVVVHQSQAEYGNIVACAQLTGA